MNKIRTIIHRWQAARLRRRVALLQLHLDEYSKMEQQRINVLAARADWHSDQAKAEEPAPTVGKGIGALIPMPSARRAA